MTQPGPRFTRRIEDFTCDHCGREVRGTGYTNHCPSCLWSRHVDVSPGDRLAECGGLMRPVAVLYQAGEYTIIQHCTACGHTWRNRAAPGDDQAAIIALAGQPAQWPAGRPAGTTGPRGGPPRRRPRR